MQSYWDITSDDYLAYISNYVVGLGPWKDTVVPAAKNYTMAPTDLVARAHAHNLQVWYLFIFFTVTWNSMFPWAIAYLWYNPYKMR